MSLSLAVTSAAKVWILTLTLSGDIANSRQYEFQSQADCEAVIPALEQLYLGLGESSVDAKCEPEKKSSALLPLNANMIIRL